MKIIFFDFIFHYGGGTQLAADVCSRVSAAGNDVEVIDVYGVCEEYMKVLAEADIKTNVLMPNSKQTFLGYRNQKLKRMLSLLKRGVEYWKLQRRLAAKIEQIKPDVIFTNSPVGLLFLGLSGSTRKYPVAWYACTCPEGKNIHGWIRWVMIHQPTLVMAISTETAKQVCIAGVEKDKIRIVFDTIPFTDTLNRSTEPLEKELPGGVGGGPCICLAGSLSWLKGQHTAIKAVAELKSQGLSPTLWLPGKSVGDDHSYVDYLHELIERHRLAENVFLLGWRGDVAAIMHHSDMIAVPSRSEGFGHVVLEGMLLKRPVIATSVGGIKDSIQDGVNGLNFLVDDHKGLAGCIKRLVEDKSLSRKLAESGYETVTGRFTPKIHTERILAALAETIKRRKEGE